MIISFIPGKPLAKIQHVIMVKVLENVVLKGICHSPRKAMHERPIANIIPNGGNRSKRSRAQD